MLISESDFGSEEVPKSVSFFLNGKELEGDVISM